MNTESIRSKYPLYSKGFAKAYVITMRPYLMFVSGITGIAGISFGELTFSTDYILLFSAAFLSYGFGQALTDCFQIDTDSISSPYRPLTRKLVSRNQFLFISSIGLAYCVLVFTFYNPLNLALGILSGFGLATYTSFKRRWWGGPFYNSWIVDVLFIMASLSVMKGNLFFLPAKFIFSLLTVFFGYANFVLSGYFKDISADRVTGYNTLPVVFGRKLSAVVSDLFALLALIFSSIAILLILGKSLNIDSLIPILFLLIGTVLSFIAQFRLHRVKADEESYRSISFVVHSYILILSAIAVANKPEWGIFLIVYYLCYLFILKIRPSKNQI